MPWEPSVMMATFCSGMIGRPFKNGRNWRG
jgi:hypothetical protein